MRQSYYPRIIPLWKFVVLCLGTFGLYQLFWMYQTWDWIKNEDDLRVSPLVRTLLAIFYVESLVRYLGKHLAKEGANYHLSPNIIGLMYALFIFSQKLPDPFWLICILSFLPLLPIVQSLNQYWSLSDESVQAYKLNYWKVSLLSVGLACLLFIVVTTLWES